MPSCTVAPAGSTSSASVTRSARPLDAAGGLDPGRGSRPERSSTHASRRSPTRRRPRSWPTSSSKLREVPVDTPRTDRPGVPRRSGRAHARASRSWRTGSTRHTASQGRSRRYASGACQGMRSRSSAPTPRSIGGCQPSPRSTSPSIPGMRIGVPSLPAAMQALIDGSLRRHPRLLAGPGGYRRRTDRPSARSASPRQLPHRADRLRRSALRRARDRRGHGGGRRCLLQQLRRRPLAQPGLRRRARRDRDRRAAGPALGPGSRHGPLRPRSPRRRAARRERIDVLYSGRITREKGVELLADSFLHARERIHACT